MSRTEIDRYAIITKVIGKELTGIRAATLLNLSARHIKRLKAGVIAHGAAALIHGNRGKRGNRAVPDAERMKITRLLHRHYHDFRPTFAAEKLSGGHGITRDPKTIRSIMVTEGLWQPRVKQNRGAYRQWRRRKDQYGELVQFDGSYEHWFEDRGPECCLLAAIDDATGQVVDAQFAEHEGVIPVFTFWRQYVATHGRPRAMYLDKFSTYRMNHVQAKENTDTKTQFGRAAQDLGIELIFAHSPQAKGRVERLFLTLQDRLIKELRLKKISTIQGANQFLREEYLMQFNKQFGSVATEGGDLHRALNAREQHTLSSIFSRHTTRTVRNDFTISHSNTWYQLTKQQPVTICKQDTVTVEEHLDGSMHLRLRGKYLNYEKLPERPLRAVKQPWVLPATTIQPQRPSLNHPWRRIMNANVKTNQQAKELVINQM